MTKKLICALLSIALLISFASCIDANDGDTSKEQSAEHSTPPKGEDYVLAKTEESALKDGKKQIAFFANTIKPKKSNDATKQYFLTLSDYLKGVWNEYDVINVVLSESKDTDVVNSYASYCDARCVEYSRSLSTRNGKTVNYMYKDNAEGLLTENTNDKIEYAQFMFSLFTFLFPEISITKSTSPPTMSLYREYYILSIDGLEITCSDSSDEVTVHLSDNETISLSLDADVDISLEPIISNPSDTTVVDNTYGKLVEVEKEGTLGVELTYDEAYVQEEKYFNKDYFLGLAADTAALYNKYDFVTLCFPEENSISFREVEGYSNNPLYYCVSVGALLYYGLPTDTVNENRVVDGNKMTIYKNGTEAFDHLVSELCYIRAAFASNFFKNASGVEVWDYSGTDGFSSAATFADENGEETVLDLSTRGRIYVTKDKDQVQLSTVWRAEAD